MCYPESSKNRPGLTVLVRDACGCACCRSPWGSHQSALGPGCQIYGISLPNESCVIYYDIMTMNAHCIWILLIYSNDWWWGVDFWSLVDLFRNDELVCGSCWLKHSKTFSPSLDHDLLKWDANMKVLVSPCQVCCDVSWGLCSMLSRWTILSQCDLDCKTCT